MIGGLRYIESNELTSGNDGGGSFNQNLHLLPEVKKNSKYLITFQKNLEEFQKETLEIIGDKFEFVTPDETDVVVNHYGENRYEKGNLLKTYDYLLQLKSRVQINQEDIEKFSGKKIFLSRKNAHLLVGNNGLSRRQIFNENELMEKLESYGINRINLEDYSITEKIKIFSLADTIISPNSGGLVFSIYAGQNTKIIEINVENPHQVSDQYLDICRHLSIGYYKFISEKIDSYDNMIVNIESFLQFYKKIK